MTIVIDTEIIELFRIQWWHLQWKFGIKVFDLLHSARAYKSFMCWKYYLSCVRILVLSWLLTWLANYKRVSQSGALFRFSEIWFTKWPLYLHYFSYTSVLYFSPDKWRCWQLLAMAVFCNPHYRRIILCAKSGSWCPQWVGAKSLIFFNIFVY